MDTTSRTSVHTYIELLTSFVIFEVILRIVNEGLHDLRGHKLCTSNRCEQQRRCIRPATRMELDPWAQVKVAQLDLKYMLSIYVYNILKIYLNTGVSRSLYTQSTFSGLRSLCAIPFEWRNSRAEATSVMILAASCSVKNFLKSRNKNCGHDETRQIKSDLRWMWSSSWPPETFSKIK